MIDLVLLREQPQLIIDALAKKDPSFDGKRLFELDEQFRLLQARADQLRAEKNACAQAARGGVTPELREKSVTLSGQIKEVEAEVEKVRAAFEALYLSAPNVPLQEDVPAGGKESNRVVTSWGAQPTFSFEPKNHVELAQKTGWIDFEAGARTTGANFPFYKDGGVRLAYQLMMFFMNNNMKHGFRPMLPPALVSEQSLIGASNFPRFREQVFAVTEDKLFLTPTAEVNLTNLYRDTIFEEDQLPIRMTAWTSCFRREAGGYGATERGLIRVHQFEKAELYTICCPDEAAEEQKRMLACAEDILQQLGLHYRVSLLAAQDCSFASTKTYDIEVWMPGQKEYKEVSSISNCADFQARRCAMRYKTDPKSKAKLVYTLNGSSLALPRVMVALMETYQQEDGTIQIPDVLKTITLTL